MSTIKTGKVTDRRKLRFESMNDVLADVDRIVTADKAGKLRRTGNWTAGQIFGHLATWINYAYEGFPMKPPPWLIRVLLKMKRNSVIHKAMDPGIQIPGVPNGTFALDVLDTEDGAAKYRKALARLFSNEPAKFDSPAWGKMTHQERIGLNMRHAELHLSFLHP